MKGSSAAGAKLVATVLVATALFTLVCDIVAYTLSHIPEEPGKIAIGWSTSGVLAGLFVSIVVCAFLYNSEDVDSLKALAKSIGGESESAIVESRFDALMPDGTFNDSAWTDRQIVIYNKIQFLVDFFLAEMRKAGMGGMARHAASCFKLTEPSWFSAGNKGRGSVYITSSNWGYEGAYQIYGDLGAEHKVWAVDGNHFSTLVIARGEEGYGGRRMLISEGVDCDFVQGQIGTATMQQAYDSVLKLVSDTLCRYSPDSLADMPE